MTFFRKKIQYFYRQIYNYLFCITKISSRTKNKYYLREYLLNQSDDNSSISNLDYNNIYVYCEKLHNF